MNDPSKISNPRDDLTLEHLKNIPFPTISLPNQEGNLLRLDRFDTFRLVIFFFSKTGRPDKPLPNNWNNTPDARGCTLLNCTFRDKYDQIISENAIPIGISTQSIDDNKEMASRLSIPFDILSDENQEIKNLLNLPVFSISSKNYLKKLVLIIEKNIIKKVFYPIYPIDKHIEEVLKWLKKN